MARFEVKFTSNNSRIPIEFTEDSKTFVTNFSSYQEVQKGVDYYTGEYTVEPSVITKQVLETKDKYLSNNVTVNELPLFRTSNEQGGVTVYIGRSS